MRACLVACLVTCLIVAAPSIVTAAPTIELPEVAAIYTAELRTVTGSDGQNQLCATAAKDASPPPRCTRLGDMLAWYDHSTPISTRGPSWIAVGKKGELLATFPCDPSGCGHTPPSSVLRDQLRCGASARFWSRLPADAVRCERDDDCALLESMCFAVAVSKTKLDGYRALLEHNGAICLSPNAGACPPSREHPRCQHRACALAPR